MIRSAIRFCFHNFKHGMILFFLGFNLFKSVVHDYLPIDDARWVIGCETSGSMVDFIDLLYSHHFYISTLLKEACITP